jgi:hypothetical protein
MVVVFIAVTAAAAGLWMFVRGVRVRRHGATPHCGGCDYPLTGLTDPAKCPECGVSLIPPGAVAIGERYRRRGLAWAGTGVLLVAAVPLSLVVTGAARGYDWYRLRPTAWVLGDLERTNSARAAAELARRYAAGSLSAAHRDRLAGLALAEQARNSGSGPLPTALIGFLAAAEANGDLSPAQRQRFFEQMIMLRLSLRPAAWPWPGSPGVVYDIQETCRSPGGVWWVRSTSDSVELQQQNGPRGEGWEGGGGSEWSGLGAGGSTSSVMRIRTHGEYTFTVRLRVGAYKSQSGTPPVHEWDVVVSEKIDVPPWPWGD